MKAERLNFTMRQMEARRMQQASGPRQVAVKKRVFIGVDEAPNEFNYVVRWRAGRRRPKKAFTDHAAANLFILSLQARNLIYDLWVRAARS